jgi:hypothetical protein
MSAHNGADASYTQSFPTFATGKAVALASKSLKIQNAAWDQFRQQKHQHDNNQNRHHDVELYLGQPVS